MASNQNLNQQRNHQKKRKQTVDYGDFGIEMRPQLTLQPAFRANENSGEDDDCLFLSPEPDCTLLRTGPANPTPDRSQRTKPATGSRSLFGNRLGGDASNLLEVTSLTTPPASDVRSQHKPVKKEQKENTSWTENVQAHDTVTIYVGRDNQKLVARRSMLSKSPILEAMIIQDPRLGEYIMRPQLLAINRSHFSTMLEFMHAQEYEPLIMTSSEVDGAKYFQRQGSEKQYSDNEYSSELVRQGHLYVLAKQFKVEGFADKVREKICEVDTSKYSVSSMLRLAGIVFNDDCMDYIECSDVLEQWIINKLASSFREIMEQQRVLLWRIEKQTTKQKLFAHVLDAVSQTYKHLGGLPEKGNQVVLD